MAGFAVTFPLYFVLIPDLDSGQYLVYGGCLPGDRHSAAIFTERIFAERDKAIACPEGVICECGTLAELEPHLSFFEMRGISHVTIDPGTEARAYAVRSIPEFRRDIGEA